MEPACNSGAGASYIRLYELQKKKLIEPELPAVTMEGKHTFGCRFDNEIWIPGRTLLSPLKAHLTGGELYIECARRDKTVPLGADYMCLRFEGITQAGKYALNSENAELLVTSSVNTYSMSGTGNQNLFHQGFSIVLKAGVFPPFAIFGANFSHE